MTMRPLLLVHGAWHGAWCWGPLRQRLEAAGISSVAVDLPGHGERHRSPWRVRWRDYVDAVHEAVCAFEVPPVLVGHSMGGGIVSAVAKRDPDRLAGLVYLAAFVPYAGETIMSLAKQDSPLAGARLRPLRGDIAIDRAAAARTFFHDCPEADHWAGQVQPQPIRPTLSPAIAATAPPDAVPRYYVLCRKDRAISPVRQRAMAERGGMRRIVEMDTGHSPFLADPESLVVILAGIAAELDASTRGKG